MPELTGLNRALIGIGIILIVLGIGLGVAPRLRWLGRLPGDILIRREGFTFYFPLTTSILISLIVSLFLRIVRK